MAGNRYDLRYAMNVHEQDNPNATKRIHWSGLNKAVSHDSTTKPTGSGSSYFEDYQEVQAKTGCKKTKNNPFGICEPKIVHHYNYPYVVTAHQFNLNIPNNAYIFKIVFTVCMKVAKGVKAKAPKGIANIYGSAWASRLNTGSATGWINGAYHMQPNVKLSTSWKEVKYELWESNIQEGGITPQLLNDAITGIDLNFTKCGDTNGAIYIKWASVAVEYDVPDNKVFFEIPTSPENPYYVKTGDQFEVAAVHTNDTWANDVNQSYPVRVPGFGYDISNNWGVTDTWNPPAPRKAKNWLWFTVKSHILGLNTIEVGGAKFWMYSLYGEGDDYYVVRITPSILRKAVRGCIQVNAHVWDEDGIVTLTVDYDVGHDDPEMNFSFNGASSSPNVSVRSITANTISFSIPPRTECEVCFDVCAVPIRSGTCTFKITDDDGDEYTQAYNVLPPYEYKFSNSFSYNDDIMDIHFLPVQGKFDLERFVTQTELGMYELDALFNEETMYITECGFNAHKFEELDYVGCVPLEHTHFDPKSDYTDTLLNETFKNKTYMGKKGVIDETISLNLRVPPRDVTTLQGLVEMDKPVPINTCHTAFEGDALNHRGWVELYGVKDVEKTNPNYYKISLDVKYLTHNIAYKFDILRHSKVIDLPIPTLYSEVLSYDDPLSNGLNVVIDGEVVESSDFFDVDTDGTYKFFPSDIAPILDENGNSIIDATEEGKEDTIEYYPTSEDYVNAYNVEYSNLFGLGEGQHVRLTSHKNLSQNVKISCNWKSDLQDQEVGEQNDAPNNTLKRVFRIKDALNKDNVLFEYQYYDFQLKDKDFVKAHVTSSYTGTDSNVRTLFNSEIAVRSDNDYDEDNNQEVKYWYGSEVIFELNGNHLTVTEVGLNGRELYGSCDLQTGSYIFECEFTNISKQSYIDDSMVYLDMEVMDTYLQTDYADMYSNLVVSPFPVIGKDVVFTRQSEEGIIYYMRDDNEPFKYLLEPYYQYHCGVDLKSREGISLFNLENRYSIFYMQNGLVRIGFNRIDGEVYLSKYDPVSEEYIPTNTFKLNANAKFDKGIFNDDKIEILADTMIFTMWRGHPYIMVNHPNNDIEIKTIFNKVFGETSADGVPSLINLMNEDNLLPKCVGGADISSSCINTIANRENIVEEHTIECVSDLEVTKDVNVTLSYLLDGEANPDVASLVRYVIEGTEINGNTYKFNAQGTYSAYAVYLGDDLNHYAISPSINITVIEPEVHAEPEPDAKPGDKNTQCNTPGIVGKFEVTCNQPEDLHIQYNDNREFIFTLRRGGTPIPGKVLEIAYPDGHVGTNWTDANGQVKINNYNWGLIPRNAAYYLEAKFYDQVNEDDDPQVIYQRRVTLHVDKQTSTITDATTYIRGNKLKKGGTAKFQFKVNGVPRGGYGLFVKYNGGSFKTYTTNNNGMISVKVPNKLGVYKYTVAFSGTTYKTEASLKKNIETINYIG